MEKKLLKSSPLTQRSHSKSKDTNFIRMGLHPNLIFHYIYDDREINRVA